MTSTPLLPVVTSPGYVCRLPEGHRFPMAKFGLLADLLAAQASELDLRFVEPQPAEIRWIEAVHASAYVRRFVSGRLHPQEQRRSGLPWSPALVRRSVLAVGGTLLAAELALSEGLACNAAGGTHHAGPTGGAGFCIFNDLAVAASTLLDRGAVGRVLVVDCDVHQGDGTAALFADDPRVFTFSIHAERNYPLRKMPSDLDVGLDDQLGDAAYMAALSNALREVDARFAPDLVLYDAGADVHLDDALGRLGLSDHGLLTRDRFVIGRFRERGIPVATVIGGGYDANLSRLAHRHSIVVRAAAHVNLSLRVRGPSLGSVGATAAQARSPCFDRGKQGQTAD